MFIHVHAYIHYRRRCSVFYLATDRQIRQIVLQLGPTFSTQLFVDNRTFRRLVSTTERWVFSNVTSVARGSKCRVKERTLNYINTFVCNARSLHAGYKLNMKKTISVLTNIYVSSTESYLSNERIKLANDQSRNRIRPLSQCSDIENPIIIYQTFPYVPTQTRWTNATQTKNQT